MIFLQRYVWKEQQNFWKNRKVFYQRVLLSLQKAEQIRNASDYDDFYIASKEESRQQVENAAYFFEKVKEYLNTIAKENDSQNEKK